MVRRVQLCCCWIVALCVLLSSSTTLAFLFLVAAHRDRHLRWRGSCRSTALFSFPSGEEITNRLNLRDRYDRWRFLQNLLDAEVTSYEATAVLYAVLEGYLRKPQYPEAKDKGSPQLTIELRLQIEEMLHNWRGKALLLTLDGKSDLQGRLELLLPDPEDDEDAHKSLWDTVTEIHGREAVKIDERIGSPEWKVCCLVARLLLHYDFLHDGL